MNEERRTFGIADGLILIAGVGAGLGAVRFIAPEITPGMIWKAFFVPTGVWSPRYAVDLGSEFCVIFVIPFFAAWTPACLLVQIKRPRPRRLRRTPGFLACLLPTLVTALTIALMGACVGMSNWYALNPGSERHLYVHLLGALAAGLGVLWSWATMAFCGICRPQPTWTDRLGRLTGVVWIAIGVLSGVYIFLSV